MSAATVVVVEDNADFATILETVLQLWGYAVESYDSIAAGRDALLRCPPAMLILDGQLPDGDGYALYRDLRRRRPLRDVPVLLLSVSDDVYQAARAASDHDPRLFVGLKPMPLEEIQCIVTSALSA
jgi:DNA-binding response OmpR family regulator